jgi:hypothetical protein
VWRREQVCVETNQGMTLVQLPDNTACFSLYFMNTTSLAKNYAIQRVICDIKTDKYNTDVCLLAGT